MGSYIPNTFMPKLGVLKSIRPGFVVLLLIVGVVLLTIVLLRPGPPEIGNQNQKDVANGGQSKRPKLPAFNHTPAQPVQASHGMQDKPVAWNGQATPKPLIARSPQSDPMPRAETPSSINTESAAQVINRLFALGDVRESVSARPTADVDQVVQQLIAHEQAAIPAISQFLQSFHDASYDVADGRRGRSTLRLTLIDALGQIGGPEAEQVLLEELQTTAEPAEIALLARILEQQAPGVYQESILSAARESLEILSQASKQVGRTNTAPLFKVLQDYGDATVAADLQRSPLWFRQSATVTLANLTAGQGIPHLIRMLQNPDALQTEQGRLAAQILVQVAVTDATAQEALFDMVRSDTIPESLWPRLAEVAAGEYQSQIESPEDPAASRPFGSVVKENPYSTYTIVGRQIQTIYQVHYSAVLTPEEFGQRLGLIEDLQHAASNPIALRALENARALLIQSRRGL